MSSAVPNPEPGRAGVDPPPVRDPGFRADLAAAWRTTWPVLLGYIPLGLAFGVLLTAAGFPWWWAFISSVVIYGGSIQYLAVDLLAGGAGVVQVAVATFFVQFRHVFYGLTHPIKRVRSLLGKAYVVHALTDEVYAVLNAFREVPTTGRFLVLCQLLCHIYWTTGATLGALLGTGLDLDVPGLDFVMTALFVVLTIETYRSNPDHVTTIASLTIGMVAFLAFGDRMLVPALGAFIALLLVRYWRERRAGTPAASSGTEVA